MTRSVYIETTIISYLRARPSRNVVRRSHQQITQKWWDIRRSDYSLVISEFVLIEASAGDPKAAQERIDAIQSIPRLEVTNEVRDLAKVLAKRLQLPQKAAVDAAHVAVCAVHNVNFLLTWNCKHLANANLTAKIEEVCGHAGYTAPRIVTPELLMEQP